MGFLPLRNVGWEEPLNAEIREVREAGFVEGDGRRCDAAQRLLEDGRLLARARGARCGGRARCTARHCRCDAARRSLAVAADFDAARVVRRGAALVPLQVGLAAAAAADAEQAVGAAHDARIGDAAARLARAEMELRSASAHSSSRERRRESRSAAPAVRPSPRPSPPAAPAFAPFLAEALPAALVAPFGASGAALGGGRGGGHLFSAIELS